MRGDAHASALWRVGRVADAAAAAGEIVAQHPLRESAWAVLIDAQARTSPGEALRTYRRAVAELAQVGLVPSDALRSAETRALLGTATHEPVRTTPGPGNRSRLIGRDDALVELGVLIQSNRLVTLVGPGGVGKTRLAKEIATRHRSDHPLGARVVSLGDVSEPAAVTAMIVEEVGIGGVDAAETELLARVGRLDMLVVIDNCEHVIDAACSAIDAILDGGDAARIVATSRQRLGLDGERVWTTAPLGRHSDAVGDDFGVELFAERAASIGVDVTADLDAVSRIVERLDGLPLAIEMAAATLTSQGLVDLETLTQSDPSVLRAPTRGAPDRQRTLANLIDWSLDDLDETTRRAAVDISVFDTTFDPSGAAAVIGDPSPEIVHDLVDRSLLAADTSSGRANYRMLWTIKNHVRRHGSDQQLAAARQRHATYHLDRLIAHDAALRTADEADADRRICDAYPDLRSAHLWSTEHDPSTAEQITGHLHVWAMSRQIGDPFRWAERLITDPATAPPAAVASLSQAWFYNGRVGDAVNVVEAALTRADGTERLLLLESLGDILLAQGDLDRVITMGVALASTAEAVGDAHFVVMGRCAQALAHCYANRADKGLDCVTGVDATAPTDRGWISYTVAELLAENEPEHAADLLKAAISAADSVTNRFLAGVARVSLSSLRARHGDPTASIHDLTETIEHWRRRGMHAYLLTSLRNLVVLLDRLDQPVMAARLIGAIDAAARLPSFGTEHEQLVDIENRTRKRIGSQRFAQLYDQSKTTPFDNVTADAIRHLRQLTP